MTTTDRTDVERAIDYIHHHGGVSFPELQRFAEDSLGMDTRGDHVLEILHNLFLWAGMSDEFTSLVLEIRSTGRVEFHPASPLVYLTDGMLKFPLAKRPPRNGYESPHWTPVTMSAAGGAK